MRTNPIQTCPLSFLLLIMLIPASVWAQVYSGSLTGVIKDPSGAVVPGAEVKLTDVNKGYSQDVKTDESGRYLLRSIAPGTYRLSVVASGFRAYLQQGIVLDVGQNASVDVALQLGEQSNTVEVTSESTLLQTEDAVTGQTINRTFANDLPLIGRYIMDLVYLTPGITRPPGRRVGYEADGEGNNFFANWEGFRNRKPNTLQAGVPSAAMRSGDFAEICGAGFDSAGQCNDPGGQLWDPYSGVYDPGQGGPVRSRFIPFNNMATYQSPGNPKLNGTPFQLPAAPGNLINPVASRMMQEYPLPNLNVGSPNYSSYNHWIRSVSDAGGRNQMDFKIDHIFGEKDRLSIRFAPRWTYYNKVNSFDSPMDPYSQGHNKYDAYSFALNHTHSFSPKTLLNVSLGYITNPVFGGNGVLPEFYPDYDISKELGVPEYLKISGALDTPAVVIPSYRASGGGTNLGNQPWGQYKQTPETYHLLVSLSRV